MDPHSGSSSFRLGAVSQVTGVADAAPVPSLGMAIVLDQERKAVELYSGR